VTGDLADADAGSAGSRLFEQHRGLDAADAETVVDTAFDNVDEGIQNGDQPVGLFDLLRWVGF
jgi:hypothetical protein